MHALFRLLLLVFAVSLAGCAAMSEQSLYKVTIDAISSGTEPEEKTYVIASSNPEVSSRDLQFLEFAGPIEKALAQLGYSKATPQNAAILITLSYEISAPKTVTSTRSVPIFGQTGVSSSTTYGQISPGGTFSGTTYTTPTFGVTGYVPVTDTYETYTRTFVLSAYDIKASREQNVDVQLWRTTVTSNGTNSDLRTVFPYMVAASAAYFGKDPGKQVTVSILEDDPAVHVYRQPNAAGQPAKKGD